MQPTKCDSVRYRLAGTDAYVGPLVITSGVLYFIPQVDVLEQKIENTTKTIGVATSFVVASSLSRNAFDARAGASAAAVAAIRTGPNQDQTVTAGAVASVLSSLPELPLSRSEDDGASSAVQSVLDGWIESLKAARREAMAASGRLPIPVRVSCSEATRVSTNWRGRLVVETAYDSFEFGVGLMRAKVAAKRLAAAGFR